MKNICLILGKIKLSDKDIQTIDQFLANNWLNVQELVTFAEQNRVIPQVYNNLQVLFEQVKHRDIQESLVLVETSYKNFVAKFSALIDSLKRAKKQIKLTNYAVFVKGLYLNCIYPQINQRYLRDIDMIIPSTTDFFNLVDLFHQNGYRLDFSMWLMKSAENGALIGASEWVDKIIEDQFVNLDIHFGGEHLNISESNPPFSQGPCMIEFPGLGQIKVLPPEDMFVHSVEHFNTHRRIMFRDINDIYVMIDTFCNSLNSQYIINKSIENGSYQILTVVLALANEIYPELKEKMPADFLKIAQARKVTKYLKKINHVYPHYYSTVTVLKNFYMCYHVKNNLLSSFVKTINHLVGISHGYFLKKYIRNGKFEKLALFLNKRLKYSAKMINARQQLMCMSMVSIGFENLIGKDLVSLVKKYKPERLSYTELEENLLLASWDEKINLLIGKGDIYALGYYTLLEAEQVDAIQILLDELKL